MRPRRTIAIATIGVALTLAGCDAGTAKPVPPSAATARRTTLLTIGGSATEGDGLQDRFREAWPYLFFHKGFPVSTSLVNAAVDGATVANAVAGQVSLAAQLHPDVAAVWLGIDDLAARTPIATFSSGLASVVHALQAQDVREILVADLPKAYGAVGPMNAAIRAVVRSTGSTLVELEDAAVVLAANGRFPAEPDSPSQAAIASGFSSAQKPLVQSAGS